MKIRIGERVLGMGDLKGLAYSYAIGRDRRPRIAPGYGTPGNLGVVNRHDVKRWLLRFAEVAAVAHDALLGGDTDVSARAKAIGALATMVSLEDALRLSRLERISDYVDITITTAPTRTLPHYQGNPGEWFLDPDVGVPYGPLTQLEAVEQSMSNGVFAALATNDKIPYNNDGIKLLQAEIERHAGDLIVPGSVKCTMLPGRQVNVAYKAVLPATVDKITITGEVTI